MPDAKDQSTSKSEYNPSSLQKHIRDWIDVTARVILSIVAIWWAITSFNDQKKQNEHQLTLQIKQQSDMMQSQRETAEAQLASSLLIWFKCEGSPQRLIAQQTLGSVSPKQIFLVHGILEKCSMGPKDRERAEKYNLQNSLDELTQIFQQQLNLARQYRSVGLQKRAAEEYEKAYNELPESLNEKIDGSTITKARESMSDGNFSKASDFFEQSFKHI